jgi:iron complex outermembrane recepter protein
MVVRCTLGGQKMSCKIIALPCSIGALIAISSITMADPPAAGPAAPATTNTGSSPSNGSEDTLEEIVVTAEKRSENLEEVPVAVSAFTSKERDLIGIETIQDLTDFTPGLGYSNALDRAFIRGIGRDTNNLATQPGVATYNDGLYNSSVFAATGDPLLLDHIEVLRGPQGTLYGRNSIGGTINAISKRPTDDWYAEARANIGNYGLYNFEAAVSGPISDSVRFRLAALRNTQEVGFFNNLAIPGNTSGGEGNAFYVEAQLEWDITKDLQFWIKASQNGSENGFRTFNTIGAYSYAQGSAASPLSPSAAAGFLVPGNVALNEAQCNNNPGSINIRSFCNNNPDSAKLRRNYQVTPQLTWNTPYDFDVKYIGGYTTYWYQNFTDFDNTSELSYPYAGVTVYPSILSQYIENKKYWSNEIDLTSHSDSSFQWIAGLYQYAEHFDQPVNLYDPGQNQLLKPSGLAGPVAPNALGDNLFYTDENIKAHSYAAFAQTDWKFLPTLKLTTGVRYNYDEESGSEATRLIYFNPATFGDSAFDVTSLVLAPEIGTPGNPAPIEPGVRGLPVLDPATGNYVRPLAASWNAVTGTAGVEWQPTSSFLGYLKYSRGYKSGGLNAGSIVQFPKTDPEFVNAYEVGLKYSVSKFQINQDFFWYDYQGLQMPLSVQPPLPAPAVMETFNLPKSISLGSETEIIWRPIIDWAFLIDYSYLHAYLDSNFSATNATATLVQPGYGVVAISPTTGVAALTGGNTNLNGSTLPIAPHHKVALNSNYTWHFTQGFLNFSTSFVYKAATYSSIFNEPYTLAPGYSTWDFRTTWTDVSNRYTVFLYCHNCSNKIGFDSLASGASVQSLTNASLNSVTETPGVIPPRQFGVQLEYRPKFK